MQTALPSHLAPASLSPAGFAPVEPRAAEVELFTPRRVAGPVRRRSRMSASSRGIPMCSPWRSRPLREHLGWRRPLRHPGGDPPISHQPRYASLLNLSTVYTPPAIIDRQDDFIGSDRRSLGQYLGARSGSGSIIQFQSRDKMKPADFDGQRKIRGDRAAHAVSYKHRPYSVPWTAPRNRASTWVWGDQEYRG
jgi:hypothetical protein